MSGADDPTPDSIVRIQPTEDALPAERLTNAFGRLHRRLDRADGRLVCWLVSDGETIDYLLETDALGGAALRDLCHEWFPSGYEVTATDRDPLAVLPGSDDDTTADTLDMPEAAVRYRGMAARHDDWQTTQEPVERPETDDDDPLPATGVLGRVAAAMARHDGPAVYQAVLEPNPDWSAAAENRCYRLSKDLDTLGSRVVDYFIGNPVERAERGQNQHGSQPAYRRSDAGSNTVDRVPPDARRTNNPHHQRRITDIRNTDQSRSFAGAARVVLAGPGARTAADDCATAFEPAAGEYYRLGGRVHEDVTTARERLRERSFPEESRLSWTRRRVPFTSNARERLVLAPRTVGHTCLLDGAALGSDVRRALGTTPAEKTGLDRPDATTLATYRPDGGGLTLGRPLDADGEPGDPIALPPSLQPLHIAWFGTTGAGKSTGLEIAILDNHAATDGPEIVFDSKGDGLPQEYLRAHLARYGDLEDVYYFDCAETLPALSFFDIRADLAAGVDRTTAVADVVDHYVEILIGLMGRERFEQAVRAPDVIRYLVKALFDPVHGSDAFGHEALEEAVSRLRGAGDADPETPTVSDPQLERLLTGVTDNTARTRDEIVNAVANRIEKVPVNDRLARLFNHVPDRPDLETAEGGVDGDDGTAGESGAETGVRGGGAVFDLQSILDEDCVVIFDTSRLRPASRRAVTLVILSKLWTALRRRTRIAERERTSVETDPTADGGDEDTAPIPGVDTEPEPPEDLPLVNLYLEEAAEYAGTELLDDLLAKGRGFGLSVTLAMQFPGQLRETDRRAYAEVLNNVATVLTGPVALDTDLATRLSTSDMDPGEMAARLRALDRGEWLARLPAGFGESAPQPFTLASGDLPPGHPDTGGLPGAQESGAAGLIRAAKLRTRREAGIPVDESATTVAATTTEAVADVADDDEITSTHPRVDTALPYTRRLPEPVAYDADAHAVVCEACGNDYPARLEGLLDAVDCCHDRASIDREAVPVCDLGLTLSPEERAGSEYSLRQLLFLQAVYDAHQGRFDPEWEYDPVRDSMTRLWAYVGIDTDAVEQLREDGLVTIDCNRPHRLYTVTSDGREVIGVSHRAGIAHGDGQGDLGESTLHRALVTLGAGLLEREVVAAPDSDAERVETYYPVDEDTRLDVAALDDDDEVVATVEAERARANHDTTRAVPADYDKMAACEPERAIWLVKGRTAAHAVLDALNDPADGEPRVEKTYSDGVPPQDFALDAPGCTEILTLQQGRERVTR